ncbi:MAG: hypothetical protein DMD81_19845 [Candidatus Rokuibacteriota bacterium]|nr:MAG: hypothetical protein DMD81_19845 [Candidatus Rokubacteria bacterium]
MRNQRGVTIIDLLLGSALVTIVGVGAGSLYLTTLKTLTVASNEFYVHQRGTQVQASIAQLMRPAVGLPIGSCAGVALPASQQVTMPGGTLCFYRNAADGHVYACTLTPGATTCASATTQDLLLGGIEPVKTLSLTFTPLVLVGVNPSVDINFELQPADSTEKPLRFAMSVTLRN